MPIGKVGMVENDREHAKDGNILQAKALLGQIESKDIIEFGQCDVFFQLILFQLRTARLLSQLRRNHADDLVGSLDRAFSEHNL